VASPITGVLQQRRDPMGGKQDSWVCCDPNGREWNGAHFDFLQLIKLVSCFQGSPLSKLFDQGTINYLTATKQIPYLSRGQKQIPCITSKTNFFC
jgi:hypothetical protein